ncbi:type II toxin-antitoxin system PemK/MazF family toxin [Wenzhouxiangella sp. EGI_FJ10409]|uniref:type II toxin-antitoxin system PemK/MazF family toxin n=1 Tax=Wenzhouxiangella sp. EGI_FJ10409 TaxID=3243767 RepID=UPI0035E06E5E
MSYSFGDVVLVRFPFTNQQDSKRRPAVVVSTQSYNQQKPDVILAAITSQVRTPLAFGEAMIQDWQAAGLLKPSVLKPVVMTVEKAMLAKMLGQLSQADQRALRDAVRQAIQ